MTPPPRFLIALALFAFLAGCGEGSPDKGRSTSDTQAVELAREGEPAIELIIDYADGVQKRFTRIPHQAGMTVLGALEFADRHPRGIVLQKSGSRDSALVTAIDDQSNQAGAEGKNWIYRVNDKLADKSAGAYMLEPGDVILWRFEKGVGVED